MITILGLRKIGMIEPGDDLASVILEALAVEGFKAMNGDVFVISHKVVSKSNGLLVDISKIKPSRRAKVLSNRVNKDPHLVEMILRDSSQVIRADRQALIVRRKDGFICFNAGVDKSNVDGPSIYARLPAYADVSANDLRRRLEKLSGRMLGVVIADTYSRPLRVGQVEFAIGVSGIEPFVDYRGLNDLYGHRLRFKLIGVADEIAAAAELVMGQGAEGIPVALVRGLTRITRTNALGLSKRLLVGKRIDLFKKAF